MVAYSFQGRFIKPIRVGLSRVSLSFDCPPKRQTIREHGKRRHADSGDGLQLYHAMRTKSCFKIGDATCSGSPGIRLYVNAGKVDIDGGLTIKRPRDLDRFAESDGFTDWSDMRAFWRENHPEITDLFAGRLIMWRGP